MKIKQKMPQILIDSSSVKLVPHSHRANMCFLFSTAIAQQLRDSGFTFGARTTQTRHWESIAWGIFSAGGL